MNFLPSLIESKYELIWKSLIRPPRYNYSTSELGRDKFSINHLNFKRTDFTIKNKRNLTLHCSFWEPFDEKRLHTRLPVVIYLPGNSSSRCEVVPLLSFLLTINTTVFSFDFSGSGHSEGEYISLGYLEQEDVITVIEYLKETNKVSTIGLCGRSMGAATAILTTAKLSTSINCIVCDSPFSSLDKLINEYVKKAIPLLPLFAINGLKKIVSNIIYDKVGFNIEDINPLESITEYEGISSLFCHALNDDLISNEHSKELYERYKGNKEIIMFDGNHNSKRPYHVLQVISLFFYEHLNVEHLEEMSLLTDNNNNKVQLSTIENDDMMTMDISENDEHGVDNENYIYTSVKSIHTCKNFTNTEP